MRIVFMGTPDFAVLPLKRLVSSQHVAAVYTQPDRPSGRGRNLAFSPVKRLAQELGLKVMQPTSLKDAEVAPELRELKPEVIVVAAFGQLLPRSILDIPRCGCLNLHPSLLPRLRGSSPVQGAILSGDEFTGVSIMLMDEGLDTGSVLARVKIPIAACDNAGTLGAKLSRLAAALLEEVLTRLSRGELEPQPQDENQATYTGLISPQDGEVDWHQSALEVSRKVRAFQPWPGCYTTWQGKKLKIISAEPLPGQEEVEVGQVIALAQEGFGVATSEGVLKVHAVQLEGKRALSAVEFLRGQRHFVGSVLPG